MNPWPARVLVAFLVASVAASAASLTWDADPATPGAQDGAGAWDAVNTNWWDGAANTNWTDAPPDTALIGSTNAAGGAIALAGARAAAALRFIPPASGTYVVTNGALTLGAGGLLTSPFSDPGAPLDLVSTSALAQALSACSLRRVVGTYAGPALSVRRTSDSTTQDIYFTSSGALDTAALLGFVGAADGVVERVHPQAGTVAVIRVRGSPRIVIGGVLQTWPHGQPRVVQGAADGLRTSGLTNLFAGGGATVFYAVSKDVYAGGRTLTGTTSNWLAFHWNLGEGDLYFNGNPNSLPNNNLTLDLRVWSFAADAASVQLYRNGGSYGSFNTPSLSAPGELDLNGVGTYSEPSSSSFGELLIFGAKLGTTDLAAVHRSQTYYHAADLAGAGQAVTLHTPVTLAAAQSWTIHGGATVTVAGAVDNAGQQLAVRSWGAVAMHGVVSGTGGLWKGGASALTIGGPAANTFSGPLTIGDNGKVILAKPAGVNAVGGDIIIAPNNGWAAGAPTGLELADDEQIPDTAVLRFTGVDWCGFRPRGRTETIAGLDGPGGKGVIENNGWNAGGPAATGTIVLQTPVGANFVYSGYVRDYDGGGTPAQISLVKNGSGTQVLSGANISYTGPTRVNGGSLVYRDAACVSPISNDAVVVLSGIANGYSRIGAPMAGSGVWIVDGSGAGTVWQNRGGFATTAGAAGTATNAIVVTATGKLWFEAFAGQRPAWGTNQPVQLTASTSALYVYGHAGQTLVVGSLEGAGLVDFYDGGGGKSLTLRIGGDGSSRTFSGPIRNSGTSSGPTVLALTKAGAGTQTLAGASTYAGVTTVAGGTLALAAAGSLSNSALITVSSGAVFDVTAAGFIGLNTRQAIGGYGMVRGSVIAQAGSRLAPGADAVLSALGTLTVLGDVGLHPAATSVFHLAGTTNAGGGFNDLVAVLGDLEPSGSVVRVEASGPMAAGTYRLFTYTGTKTTFFNPAPVFGGGGGGLGGYVDDTSAVGQVNLVVTGSYASLTWLPQANASWNFVDGNWSNEATAALSSYADLNRVRFSDAGAYSNAVTIPAEVQPLEVLVAGASNYVFAGAGGIAGVAGLTKAGPGTLTLANTNLYLGPTTVSGGVLRLQSVSLPNSAVQVEAGARLEADATAAPVILARPIAGAGSLAVTGGANWVYVTADHTFTGGTWVANPGALLLGSNTAAGRVAGVITNHGTLGLYRSDAHVFSNRVVGTGELNLYQPSGNTLTVGGGSVVSQNVLNVYAGTFADAAVRFTNSWHRTSGAALTIAAGASVNVSHRMYLTPPDGNAMGYTYITGGALTAGVMCDARDSVYTVIQSGGEVTVGQLLANQTYHSGNSGGSSYTQKYILEGGRLTAGQIWGGNATAWSRAIDLYLGGGTLRASASQSLDANNIFLTGTNGNVTIDTAGYTVSHSYYNPMQGTGGLNKAGGGTLALHHAEAYTGPTTVSNGVLLVQRTLATGGVFVAAGGTLGGTGVVNGAVANAGVVAPGGVGTPGFLTVAALDQSPGGGLSIELGGLNQGVQHDCLLAGSATLGGTLNVSLINGFIPTHGDSFTVLRGGPVSGTFATTNLALPLGFGGTVAYTPTSVVVGVTGQFYVLSWRPTASADWDLAATNWVDTYTNPLAFAQNAAVRFDDAGAYSNLVTLTTNLQPSRIVVDSTSNYWFQGPGWLGGGLELVKTGAAALVVTTTNSFSGPTIIHEGTLQLGDGGASARLGGGTVSNNARLVFHHGDSNVITAPISGGGTVSKLGTGTLTFAAFHTYSGTTTVENGVLLLAANAGSAGTLSGPLTVHTGAVAVTTVINALGWAGAPWVRTINLHDGVLATAVVGDNGWGLTVNMVGGSLLALVPGGYFSMGAASVVNVGATDHAALIGAALTVRDTITFNVARGVGPEDLVVTGRLLNASGGGITKNGAGILRLTASNTFVGAATLNGGTMQIADDAALGAGALTLAGGTLATLAGPRSIGNAAMVTAESTVDTTGGDLTLRAPLSGPARLIKLGPNLLALPAGGGHSGELVVSGGVVLVQGTLGSTVTVAAAGAFGGTGVLSGSVTQDGLLAPGLSLGTLSVLGQIAGSATAVTRFELGGTNAPADFDRLLCADIHYLDGELQVVTTNGYVPAAGDSFRIIENSGGLLLNSFASTDLPALGGGLGWAVQYASDSVTLVVTGTVYTPTPYEAWAESIPNPALRGDQEDADGDGQVNLWEYSQGSDPTNSGSVAKLQWYRTNGMAILRFNRATGAVDIIYEVEASYGFTNPAPWEVIASNVFGTGWNGDASVTETNSGAVRQVLTEDNDPASTRRGMRLRVTRP